MDTSRHVMQVFREERLRAVRHYAGNRYSSTAAPKRTYVNLISLYVNIVGRNLFAKNPRIALTTYDQSSRPVVSAMETWINEELKEMNFAGVMQRIVLDSLFAIGIAKVALATPAESSTVGWNLQAGTPFIARIDLDDFVFDHHARDFSEAAYLGHRFRVPLASVKDSNLYNAKARDKLVASDDTLYNKDGDERIGAVGRGNYGYQDEYEDMVDLWEIYCPRQKCVYTVTEDDLSGPNSAWENQKPIPLREQDWLGPDTGPYHILAHEIIPGNPFPKGPIQNLIDLHESANESYRKLVRQAANQKDMVGYSLQVSEDAAAIKTTNDGGMVGLRDPKSIVPIQTGGVNQGQFLMMKELTDRFSLMAGNLITMGGLAPQAGTLGQEELLAQQSNGQVASMQDTTAAHVEAVSRAMLWYWWHDPYRVMRSKFETGVPGLDIVQEIHPWDSPAPNVLKRAGEMPKMKIDPYSMRYQTPQQRVAALTEVVTKIFIPLASLAQQQGITLDFNEFLSIIGKNTDQPDLHRILTIMEPPQTEGMSPGAQGGGMPAETTRNYNRRSLGGESKQAQDAQMETMMEKGPPMNGQLQKT